MSDAAFRDAAREMYVGHGGQFCNGDIDIDEDGQVSSSDHGAYVAAWVWVPRSAVREEVPHEP